MPQCSNSPGDEDFSQEIILSSITVFWHDLGLPRILSDRMRNYLADKWEEEIGPWLVDNIRGHCQPYSNGIWFHDPKDAMLFKLTWSGQMI